MPYLKLLFPSHQRPLLGCDLLSIMLPEKYYLEGRQ